MAVKFSLGDKLAARTPPKALARALELRAQQQHERAFRLLSVAAEAGLTVAARELGLCYLSGEGPGLRSVPEAVRWFTRAAEAGDIIAQSQLAGLYASGFKAEAAGLDLFSEVATDKPDMETALRWAVAAGEAGDGDAQALAGFIYTTGPEELRDKDKATFWYKRAAESDRPQGHLGYGLALLADATSDEPTFAGVEHIRKAAEADLPLGHYYLGIIYETAVGVLTDLGLAAHHYGIAAKAGIREAQGKYGFMLLQGLGIKQNKLEGETWLRRAALAGDSHAAGIVGDIYARGDDELPPNYAEAATWFRLAAEGGQAEAAKALGLLYLTGAGGVPRDADEAAKWLRMAAEAGNSAAQAELAGLQRRGQLNPRITTAAPVHEWFEQAAESGDLVGAYNYAVCLAEGMGMARDDARAAHWFRRAAEGVVNAQYRYGRMLMEGRGVAQDFAEARIWLRKAAQTNMADALIDLAALLVQGLGGPRDDEAARQLFEQAAAQNRTEAMFALGALYGGGHDIPTDRAVSLAWYAQAAERGHARAALMVGKYLRLGIATPINIEGARTCFTQAAQAGLEEAQAELASLPAPGTAEPPPAQE